MTDWGHEQYWGEPGYWISIVRAGLNRAKKVEKTSCFACLELVIPNQKWREKHQHLNQINYLHQKTNEVPMRIYFISLTPL
jgi:hypothetical protein